MSVKIDDLASRLSKRVTILQPTEVADGAGGLTITWNEFATVWAEITPRRATEDSFAGQVYNLATHKITLRYLDGLNAKMTIAYDERKFDIISILNVGEGNAVLEILAEELLK